MASNAPTPSGAPSAPPSGPTSPPTPPSGLPSGPPTPPPTFSAPHRTQGATATPEDIKLLEAFFATPYAERTAEQFERCVLGCPPIDGFVKFEQVTGRRGEQRHVPAKAMYDIADQIFQSWDVSHEAISVDLNQKNQQNQVTIAVSVRVVYPVPNHEGRAMTGYSSASMAQTTPTEAAAAGAIKNAMRRLGNIFGRGLYSTAEFADTVNTSSAADNKLDTI